MINYDRLADDYAIHRRVHPEVLWRLVEACPDWPNGRILEIGCGTGNYINAIKQHVSSECWGLDPSAGMLAKAEDAGEDVRFIQGNAMETGLSEKAFDLVYTVDVIHHVGSKEDHYHEVYRVLRGGGSACTVTDSESIIKARAPLSVYFPESVSIELRRYPSIDMLKRAMKQAGFVNILEMEVTFEYEITDIQPYEDRAYSILHLISDDAHRRGIERMQEDLDEGPISGKSMYVLLWGAKPVNGVRK